uniref:Uncharacterized protein n=1 Tax=Manihot esculenta TaxID=3983 RepID=A0A2C9VVM2_MANES
MLCGPSGTSRAPVLPLVRVFMRAWTGSPIILLTRRETNDETFCGLRILDAG